MRKIFKYFFHNFSVDCSNPHLFKSESECDQFFDGLLQKNYDVIISHPIHSEKYGKLRSHVMKETFKGKFFTTTNVYYRAFYPDLTTYSENGKGFLSPVHFHSSLIIKAFKSSYTLNQTIADFFAQTFDCQKIHNSDVTELLKREDGVDIKFAQDFFNLSEQHISMRTHKHPTNQTIALLAKTICKYLGIQFDFNMDNLPHCSEHYLTFPLLEKAATQLNFKPTPLLFRKGNGDYLSLEEFIQESFTMYEQQGMSKNSPVEPSAFFQSIDNDWLGLDHVIGK